MSEVRRWVTTIKAAKDAQKNIAPPIPRPALVKSMTPPKTPPTVTQVIRQPIKNTKEKFVPVRRRRQIWVSEDDDSELEGEHKYLPQILMMVFIIGILIYHRRR